MDQAAASQRYYLFEQVLEDTPAFANLRRRRSMTELQLLAGLVWSQEGRGKCPTLLKSAGSSFSCYDYEAHSIRLVRKHMNAATLLHELAHALGRRDKLLHGPAFRKRCLRLYKTYGDWSGAIA